VPEKVTQEYLKRILIDLKPAHDLSRTDNTLPSQSASEGGAPLSKPKAPHSQKKRLKFVEGPNSRQLLQRVLNSSHCEGLMRPMQRTMFAVEASKRATELKTTSYMLNEKAMPMMMVSSVKGGGRSQPLGLASEYNL